MHFMQFVGNFWETNSWGARWGIGSDPRFLLLIRVGKIVEGSTSSLTPPSPPTITGPAIIFIITIYGVQLYY